MKLLVELDASQIPEHTDACSDVREALRGAGFENSLIDVQTVPPEYTIAHRCLKCENGWVTLDGVSCPMCEKVQWDVQWDGECSRMDPDRSK